MASSLRSRITEIGMKIKKTVTLPLSNSSLLVVIKDLKTMKQKMSRAPNQKYAAGRDGQEYSSACSDASLLAS